MDLVATISQKRDVEVRVAMLRLINRACAAFPIFGSLVRSVEDMDDVLKVAIGDVNLDDYEETSTAQARMLRSIALDMTRQPDLRTDLEECFQLYTGTVVDPPTDSVGRAAALLLLWSALEVSYKNANELVGVQVSIRGGLLPSGITSQLDALLTS